MGLRSRRGYVAGLTFLVVCAAAIAVSSAHAQGTSRALLIGINDYVSPLFPDLRGAINDVDAMYAVLTTKYGFEAKNIRVLKDGEARRADILKALDRLVEETAAGDVVYVHFSGHGSQVKDLNGDEKDDDGLDETILPYDARTEGIADITDDELDLRMSRIKTPLLVVTLDSCHSGTGTRSTKLITRRVPPDEREELYRATVTTRDIVSTEEKYVLMTGAAAHESALDGPVDGKVYGFFSHSLATSLTASPEDAKPEQVFAGVRKELRRIQEQLGGYSMPTPQLELRASRLEEALFPAPARTRDTASGARKPFVLVRPLDAGSVLLAGGARARGVPGSLWAVYAPGEREFRPARHLATGVVTETRGDDAVLRVASRIESAGTIAKDSRAVVIASPAPGKVPVGLGRIPPSLQTMLRDRLGERFGEIAEIVGEDAFARFVLDRVPAADRFEISDSTGTQKVGVVEGVKTDSERDLDRLAEAITKLVVRSRNATELLALENLASTLELRVEVHRGLRARGSDAEGLRRSAFGTQDRGIRVTVATAAPRYRVLADGAPRTPENSLQLEITASADCFITVIDVDPAGDVYTLFPHDLQNEDFYPNGRIPGGETIVIPDSLEDGNRSNLHFDYAEPAGIDTIKVFAATDEATAEMIRASVRQAEGVGARSIDVARTFGALQRALVRPRGIVVRPADPSGGGVELIEPFDPDEFAVSTELAPPGASAPLAGDWTATSITILVETDP